MLSVYEKRVNVSGSQLMGHDPEMGHNSFLIGSQRVCKNFINANNKTQLSISLCVISVEK